MGKGNRSGLESGDDSEKTSSSSLDFDVGLGLKMQPTESFPCKRMTMVMPHHLPPPSTTQNNNYGCGFGVDKVTCLSDIYDVVGGSGSLSAAAVSPRPLYLQHPYNTDTSSLKSSGGMAASGEVLFTVSQWQELERQTMIYKYMMASIPVPHELILPIIKTPSHSVSQSNTSALELRFPSGGSDPEPWRCKRTDGKKWRCSRDVVPDQKYCERHAHKSRPRSRKPVEIQSHTTTTTTTTAATTNSYPHHPPSNTPIQPFQKPISHFPTLISAPSYDQSRCIDWFMKGGAIPVSDSTQQWQQQLIHSSARMGLKGDHSDINKNVSVFQQHNEEEQEPMNLNPYMNNNSCQRFENQQFKNQSSSTTRHFIDAWSAADREDMNVNKNCSENSDRKQPFSSLSLSMNGRNGIDEALKSQWLSPVSWMDSPPGGPLGEALCLGIASGVKVASNVASPHGYSNSTTTSCNSKSSCEDGGHVLNFIG